MSRFILFCLLINIALAAQNKVTNEDVILTKDIILTAESIRYIFKTPLPKWVKKFDKEAKKYKCCADNQSSLSKLRATGHGNCVAFAKLGAWYAIQAGYNYKFIAVANGKNGHMSLYATQDGTRWIISNKTRRAGNSVRGEIFKMDIFGGLVVMDSNLTTEDLDADNKKVIEINGGIVPR